MMGRKEVGGSVVVSMKVKSLLQATRVQSNVRALIQKARAAVVDPAANPCLGG